MLPGRVAADDDGVVQGIAEDGQHARGRRERRGDRRQDPAIEQLEAGKVDQTNASRRPLTARATVVSITELTLPHEHHLQGCWEDSGNPEAPGTGSGYGSSTPDPRALLSCLVASQTRPDVEAESLFSPRPAVPPDSPGEKNSRRSPLGPSFFCNKMSPIGRCFAIMLRSSTSRRGCGVRAGVTGG